MQLDVLSADEIVNENNAKINEAFQYHITKYLHNFIDTFKWKFINKKNLFKIFSIHIFTKKIIKIN